MSLPISIDNVPYYKVVGQYCFKGDLIFTTGRIFFFPHTDLEKQRTELREVLDHFHSLGLVIDVVRPILRPLLLPFAIRSANNSELRASGLWGEGESSETLRLKLEGRIAELKGFHTPLVSLPIPLRFTREEVRNLKLSATGILSFEAQSDRHDFGVGLFKKHLLRETLWESGFTSGSQNS